MICPLSRRNNADADRMPIKINMFLPLFKRAIMDAGT